MIKCDYALPQHLADSLMLAIQQSHFFKRGDLFAIPRKSISSVNSYFRLFTSDAISGAAEADGGPAYALDMILSHVPGGASSITLLGTSVKLATSIIIEVLPGTRAPRPLPSLRLATPTPGHTRRIS